MGVGVSESIIYVRTVDLASAALGRMANQWTNQLNRTARASISYANTMGKTYTESANQMARSLGLAGNEAAYFSARVINEMEKVTPSAGKLGAAFQQLFATQKWDAVITKIHGITQALQRIGLLGVALVTGPMLMLGRSIIDVTVEFDKQMRRIQVITKDTDSSINSLGDSFRKMSTDITKTTDAPEALAAAYFDIVQRGFSAADSQKVLAASTKAATAAFTDTLTAAKGIGQVIQAYGWSTDKATYISDIFFRTIDRGVVTFDDLAQNMSDVTPLAAITSVGLNEVAAAIATMTLQGMPAAEAFTALKRVFLTYIKPQKQAAEFAAEHGIILSGQTLAARGLYGAMQDLYQAFGDDEDALGKIFTRQEALRGSIILMNNDMSAFRNTLDYVTDSAGQTEEAFTRATKSYEGQLKNLKNKVTDLKIGFGQELIPELIRLADTKLTPLLNQLQEMSDAERKAWTDSVLLKAEILALAGPLALVASALTRILTVVVQVGKWFFITSGNASALGAALGTVAGLGASLAVIIGAAGVAILGLLQALEWEAVKKWADELAASKDEEEALIDTHYKATGATYAMIGALFGGSSALADHEQMVRTTAYAYEDLLKAEGDYTKTERWKEYQMGVAGGIAAIQEVVDASYSAGASMAYLGNAIYRTSKDIDNTKSSMLGIAEAIRNLASAVDWASRKVNGLWGELSGKEFYSPISEDTIKKADDFATAVAKAFKTLRKNGITVTDAMRASFYNLWKTDELDAWVDAAVQGQQDAQSAAEQAAKDSQQAWQDAIDDMKSRIRSALEEGISASINLDDVRYPGGAESPFAPGANGPFEDIYRLQAWAKGMREGGETTWGNIADKYAGGDLAKAMQIIRDFQMGNFTPEVTGMIDIPKFAEILNQQAANEASLSSFVDKVAQQAGVSADAVRTAMGLPTTAETAAAANTATATTAIAGLSSTMTTHLQNILGFITTNIPILHTDLVNILNAIVARIPLIGTPGAAPIAGIPNPGATIIGTSNVSVTIQPGAVQVISDRGAAVADEIVAAVFRAFSKAEERAGYPAPAGLPGAG